MDGVARKDERFTVDQGNVTSVVGTAGSFSYGYTDPQNTQAVTKIVGPAGTLFIAYDADGWVRHEVDIGPEMHERFLSFDASGCMRESRMTSSIGRARDKTTVTHNLCGSGGTRAYRETTKPDASIERVYYLPDGSELRPDDDLFVMQLPVATATMATLAWSLTDGRSFTTGAVTSTAMRAATLSQESRSTPQTCASPNARSSTKPGSRRSPTTASRCRDTSSRTRRPSRVVATTTLGRSPR